MPVYSRRVLPTEPKEGLLHDVPRRVRAAKQPRGVSDQWPLVAVERVDHPLGVWYPAHSVPALDNGAVANLLDRDYGKVACLLTCQALLHARPD